MKRGRRVADSKKKPTLEIKRTSITRLKQERYAFFVTGGTQSLEIKRTSITRLKLIAIFCSPFSIRVYLKSKEPRLRDWNQSRSYPGKVGWRCLKSKEPRLRDWNPALLENIKQHDFVLKSKEPRLRDWNHPPVAGSASCLDCLEIKRTSITRLKLTANSTRVIISPTWNQKNLDYEIETSAVIAWVAFPVRLEIKRTSITRLKPINLKWQPFGHRPLKSKEPRLRDWNCVLTAG